MARVSEAFLKQYESIKVSELKKPIVFVVDMIYGFIHEGALHDNAINDITPNIISLIEREAYRNVFVCDAHPPKTREFHAYPQHCVKGRKESEVIEELVPFIHETMYKNSTNAFTSPDFQLFLKKRIQRYQDIIITG